MRRPWPTRDGAAGRRSASPARTIRPGVGSTNGSMWRTLDPHLPEGHQERRRGAAVEANDGSRRAPRTRWAAPPGGSAVAGPAAWRTAATEVEGRCRSPPELPDEIVDGRTLVAAARPASRRSPRCRRPPASVARPRHAAPRHDVDRWSLERRAERPDLVAQTGPLDHGDRRVDVRVPRCPAVPAGVGRLGSQRSWGSSLDDGRWDAGRDERTAHPRLYHQHTPVRAGDRRLRGPASRC